MWLCQMSLSIIYTATKKSLNPQEELFLPQNEPRMVQYFILLDGMSNWLFILNEKSLNLSTKKSSTLKRNSFTLKMSPVWFNTLFRWEITQLEGHLKGCVNLDLQSVKSKQLTRIFKWEWKGKDLTQWSQWDWRKFYKKSMILVVYQRCHQFFGRKKCCDKFLKNFKTNAPILTWSS